MSIPWIVFLVGALMYSGYGLALAYHWIRWAYNPIVLSLALLTYTLVGVVLFGFMFATLTALSV